MSRSDIILDLIAADFALYRRQERRHALRSAAGDLGALLLVVFAGWLAMALPQ